MGKGLRTWNSALCPVTGGFVSLGVVAMQEFGLLKLLI